MNGDDRRRTHHGRGKGHLAHDIGGKSYHQTKKTATSLFGVKPKVTEPDTVGRKVRPAAHKPREAARAKRITGQAKRTGDRKKLSDILL